MLLLHAVLSELWPHLPTPHLDLTAFLFDVSAYCDAHLRRLVEERSTGFHAHSQTYQ